jgi:transcriptional regulator with XRE-family HTH domain
MARVGAKLSVREVAARAGVSTHTLNRLENGEELKPKTLQAIRQALEAAGVEFIDENGGGAGVRLKKASAGPT